MTFTEFKNEIMEKLTDYYGDDAEISIKEVFKTNDICHTAVAVKLCDESSIVAPMVYIDQMYENMENGLIDMDDVIENIISTVENVKPVYSLELDKLADWEYVKDFVYPVVVNANKNTKYLDLYVFYSVRVMDDSNGIGSFKITKELYEKYDITQEELHKQAMKNLRKAGYTTKSMTEIMKELMGEEEIEAMLGMIEDTSEELYVTTTKNKINGAASILDLEYFKAQYGKQDAYIIPSSIHELIVLPALDRFSVDHINKMIVEVNMSCVQDSDVLSDHAYLYDGSNGLIRCA